MRKQITESGGEFLFEKKVVDLLTKNDSVNSVKTFDGDIFETDAVILATGHSARDIFQLLHDRDIKIESKSFALGVRVEHSQDLINRIQYHCNSQPCDPFLPPASYSLVEQIEDKGVFSFCMCPGGIVAPAATSDGEVVVNGWSPSKRNNPYANSGIVVEIQNHDFRGLSDFEDINQASKKILNTPLGMMYFQQYVERKAFSAGGGKFVAPAQRLVDFCRKKTSSSLPPCSYLPGVHSALLHEVLPAFVYKKLQAAFPEFGKKMKGYFTNDAVVVATESRSSSPVRIPRLKDALHHPQFKNLYPCGEGAGYAGGIVSAALDGEKIANQIASVFSKV